ncbi:MAG: 23S rRNA (guanosine(2251)-2'-O)-methyltransferase RlmB [Pseudomonadota bacterium]|nr:MAG: 23S rRNA (guanosine(2251)-2'-O)-methyltransferase RlmB [Pseudomonadota bacterium]
MGINAVQGLLDHAPGQLVRVWLRPGGKRLETLEARLADLGVAVEHADQQTLGRLAGKVRHQGVIAEFRPRAPIDEHALERYVESAGDQALLLVLDGVQDPHNLGACLRTAAAAGATAVVVPKDRAVSLTPAARRAAAGAAERIPLAVVTNLARTLRHLGGQGVWRLGLDAGVEEPLFETELSGSLALVLGGEEKGLRRLTREHCDRLVAIPMPGGMESLNVSVAAGIALFSAVARRMSACQ